MKTSKVPFSNHKRESSKPKNVNNDLQFLKEDPSRLHTYTHGTMQDPSLTPFNLANPDLGESTFYKKPSTKTDFSKNGQNYVFIKVKDRHQFDLNPKLIKFYLGE